MTAIATKPETSAHTRVLMPEHNLTLYAPPLGKGDEREAERRADLLEETFRRVWTMIPKVCREVIVRQWGRLEYKPVFKILDDWRGRGRAVAQCFGRGRMLIFRAGLFGYCFPEDPREAVVAHEIAHIFIFGAAEESRQHLGELSFYAHHMFNDTSEYATEYAQHCWSFSHESWKSWCLGNPDDFKWLFPEPEGCICEENQ